MKLIPFLITLILGFSSAKAQILIEDPTAGRPERRSRQAQNTETGETAARKYFSDRKSTKSASDSEESSSRYTSGSSERYMSIHFGGFIDDKQYRWGDKDRDEDVGTFLLGVTYRVGEWVNSMDLHVRAELNTYEIDDDEPVKLSLMPVVAFPDAASGFPLYFGAGAGLGIFFSQVGEESDLSFDYAIVSGLRFPELFEGGGLMFELGYKGHVLLLSSGQFSGVYAAAGAVFEF